MRVVPTDSDDDEESVARSVLSVARVLAAELHPGMAGVDTLGVDASIERDFWLDSLGRVELGMRTEQTLGSAVPDAVLAEAETIRDIARALVPIRGTAAAAVVPLVRTVAERAAAPAPIAPATLLDALDWHAAEQPQRTHILLADRETEAEPISFGDLRREAVAVAAGLKRHGIRPGEAVALMLPTGREFFAAFYGALYAQARSCCAR
jgi:acyl carrier protein